MRYVSVNGVQFAEDEVKRAKNAIDNGLVALLDPNGVSIMCQRDEVLRAYEKVRAPETVAVTLPWDLSKRLQDMMGTNVSIPEAIRIAGNNHAKTHALTADEMSAVHSAISYARAAARCA